MMNIENYKNDIDIKVKMMNDNDICMMMITRTAMMMMMIITIILLICEMMRLIQYIIISISSP